MRSARQGAAEAEGGAGGEDRQGRPDPVTPPHLYKAETIERFKDAVREVFLSGKHEMTRTYLRLLVDKIVLHGEVAEVVVRTAGAAALMAQGTSELGTFTAPEAVLTSVKGWLQLLDSNQRPGG